MTKEDYILVESLSKIAFKSCRIKEDAEDVMQDVCLRVCKNEKFPLLSIEEKKRYLIFAIKNQLIDKYRNKNIEKRKGYNIGLYYKDEPWSFLQTKPDVYAKMEWKEVLKRARGHDVCETLFLNLAGYNYIEIAAIEKRTPNSILQRFRYARRFLRKHLNKDECPEM